MLKTIAKRIVRKDHWDFVSWHHHKFGFFQTIRAYIGLRRKGIGEAPNPLTGGVVFLRPGTTDQDVYDEIFISKEYDIDLGDPRFIVDAGAHIGLSSVFFACKYPKATIIALEPEPLNFDLLIKNTNHHPNIRPLQAGLWSRKTHLRIENSDVPTWSFRVVESLSGEGIPAVGVRDLMTDFKANQIDVLKVDIEGSEFEVLNHSGSWIDNVTTLIIELHDRFRPGCSEALANAIRGHSYQKSISGESLVIANLERKATYSAFKLTP